MKTRLLLGLLAVMATVPAAEFRGRLDPAVEPGTRLQVPVIPAPADVIAALPAPPSADDKVWAPNRPLDIKGKSYLLAIVASASGKKTLFLDRNRDGKFGADEKWQFPPSDRSEVLLDVPWDNGIFQRFPLRVELLTNLFFASRNTVAAATAAPAATRVTAIVYNFNITFSGTVDVDGQPLRVVFGPKPADLAIDPANQRVSLDANLNGRIEPELGEAENGSGKVPVFRVGARYLAVKSADVRTGDIVLEERPASDFTRFAAEPGQTMPDFAFVDLDGGRHKLSDFRGKYVLLDFWGTWCGPCIEAMKHLDPLYAKYHARGFEVIGMDMEKTAGHLSAADYATAAEKARAFIAKAGHPWPQATQESIERVALDVIHVNSYPTCILLGPDGKVISREARGETLARLLEKHLP